MSNKKIVVSYAQARIWEFIQTWIADKKYPPTIMEISNAMRYASGTFVARTISELSEMGAIVKVPKIARSISIPNGTVVVPKYGERQKSLNALARGEQ